MIDGDGRTPPATASATAASTQAEPTLATATPASWRAWLAFLVTYGQGRLAALGLALVLGFGVALVTLYLFAILADTVAEGDTERLDTAVLLWLRQFRSPALDVAAWFCSMLGAELLAVFLVLLLVAFAYRRRWGAAVALLLVTVGAQLQNNVLKDLFQRTRPTPLVGLVPAQAFSFPSGHAMVAAAFYLFVGYVSWRLLRGRLRVACVTAIVVVVLVIGLSRLYLGVHYFTDVVAGYLAGLAWANAVIIGGTLLGRRRRVTDPIPATAATAPPVPPPTGSPMVVSATSGDPEPAGSASTPGVRKPAGATIHERSR